MDNGEVIPGLNEDWTLGGAKLGEWVAGFMMFIIASELIFTKVGRDMPQLMFIWIVTTFGMAAMRRAFPDEERGIRNSALTAIGVEPPNLPTPASLQPYWSGAPVRELKPECHYMQLGLHELFEVEQDEEAFKVENAH